LSDLERQIASTRAEDLADETSTQKTHDQAYEKLPTAKAALAKTEMRVKTFGIVCEDFSKKFDLENPIKERILTSIESIRGVIDFADKNLPKDNNPFVAEFEDGSGQLQKLLSHFADELETNGRPKHKQTAHQLIVDGRPIGRSLHSTSLNRKDDRNAVVKQNFDRSLHRLRSMNGSEDDTLPVGLDVF
jgi:hypothetical protein